jgi:hypothetical protein
VRVSGQTLPSLDIVSNRELLVINTFRSCFESIVSNSYFDVNLQLSLT